MSLSLKCRCITAHFIGEIDSGSPAERGGLKENDRLVAVNGEEVSRYTHEQVVDKIRQLGNRCCLLVVDPETDKVYKMVCLFHTQYNIGLSTNILF